MNKNILIILSILFAFHFCNATTYYVSPRGDNTTGLDSLTAFHSVQQGVDVLFPGDSLVILTGTYIEQVKFKRSGKATKRVIVNGVGNVTIMANASVGTYSGVVNIVNYSYITIKNINVSNSPWYGIHILNLGYRPKNIRIENCTTENTGSSGLYAKGADSIYFYNNTATNACMDTIQQTGSQECITLSGVNHFEIINNNVINGGITKLGGEGIMAKNSSNHGLISKNTVYGLVRQGIYVDAFSADQEDIEINANTVYECGQGIVLSCEQGGTLRNVRIFNNLTYKNRGDGIIVSAYVKSGPKHNIKIINNTSIYNGSIIKGYGRGISIEKKSEVDSLEVKNNICYKNVSEGIFMDTTLVDQHIVSNNLVFPINRFVNSILGDSVITAKPLFVDTATNNYNLSQNSPAIDKGTLINAPEKDIRDTIRAHGGNGIDIGAYERINIAPTVSFTKPLSDTTIFAPESITISANAIDSDGTITNVSFYNGSTLLGSSNVSPYSYTLVNPTEGQYTFVAKATDGSGAVATSSPLLIDYKKVYVNGLLGNYYNNVKNWTNNLALTRVDQQINFSWENDSPAIGVSADNFSVKWTGKIQAAKTETYTFYTYSDDGAYLKINGVVLIDKLVNQLRTSHSGSIALVAGTKYDIELRYYEAMGQAICKFQWSSPTTAKQIVPSSALFSEPIVNSRVGMPITEMSFLDNESTSIYPNPTTGFVHIFSWKDGDKVVILDTKGNQMLQSNTNSSFWMGDLPNDIYILMHQGKAHKIIKE